MLRASGSSQASLPLRRSDVLAVLLLLLLAAQLTWVARLYSANWDEAHHLYDGYNIWTHGDYRLNAEVPPLLKLSAALPLLGMHLQPPPALGNSQSQSAFLEGRAFVFGNGGDRVLFPARLMCILFSLALAAAVFLFGRHLFGSMAGLLALALLVFDPNLLAHGSLISTDVSSALLLFTTVAALLFDLEKATPQRLIATGLLAGLTLVSKFTGILVIPLLLVLPCVEALRQHDGRLLGRWLLRSVGMLVIAWLVIWTFYGFRYAPAPHGLPLSPTLGPYLASLPNHSGEAELSFFARLHLLPEAYLWGLANTRHTEWQYVAYFLGRIYRHGPWAYFPVAFFLKSTLPLLLALLLSPFLLRRPGNVRTWTFLLVPVISYFTLVTTSHFDIGARHLLPIYPFLYVIAGAALASALQRGPAWTAVAATLLVWQGITSLRVAPAYMAYGNEAMGGPLAVHHYLSDSNVDWGQQLKTVRSYLDEHHITNCWFAYFPDGAVEARDYGVNCHRLPTPSGLWWFELPMQVPPVIEGTVLISESDLEGVESGDGALNPYKDFQPLKPVAVLQDGVYVYQGRFAVPLAAAWGHVHQAQLQQANGDLHGALQSARQAVQLAPNQARTQLTLAQLLEKTGQWTEAAEHFQAAQHWLDSNRPDLESEDFAQPIADGLRETAQRRALSPRLRDLGSSE